MIEQISSFSRARTLLLRAVEGRADAPSRTGEAGVSTTVGAPALSAAEREIVSGDDVDLVHVHERPARSGTFGTWPEALDPRLVDALHGRGIAQPYAHQEISVRASLRGDDVVLATSTASGKSLCFQVPVIDAALRDPSARALMLFPTKALARDQVASMRTLSAGLAGAAVGVGVYDGDTPPDERRACRSRAHAVATNPDMLHRGLLPHHERWAAFLAGLRWVVLDELHTYRGLFGSHVANVMRRLLRLCAHYGASPRVIACSATIANPAELLAAVCPGLDPARIVLVDRDDAPSGPRRILVVNPRVVDAVTGVRRDYLKVTRRVTSALRRHGVSTLAFCRTRKAVELLTRYLRDDEAADRTRGASGHAGEVAAQRAADTAIRGYRGGYLPERRREVEQAMRDGEAQVVASTNALELGMDIGGVDAVVLSGYPGTRAATWQRLGRAGRRARPSLGVLVLSSTPLDQFIRTTPGFLFEQSPEQARVDPDNPEVFLPHLRCAVHELPMTRGDTLAGLAPDDVALALDWLADGGALWRETAGDGPPRYASPDASPAEQIDVRGPVEENFSVLDPAGDVLAQVDFEDAPLYLHPGAIYAIEGRTFEVLALDWDARKASVRSVAADYYTEAISNTRVRVLDPSGEPLPAEVTTGVGLAHLRRTVPGFKKIRFGTHENIGFGPIALPDLELHTTSAFWGLPAAHAEALGDPAARAAAMLAAAHALHHVAAMLMMCDTGDLGHAVTAAHPSAWGEALAVGRKASALAEVDASTLPFVVLYDRTPGGAGLASQAHALGAAFFDRAIAIVERCGCARGCPTCMGPTAEASESFDVDRAAVRGVLEALRAQVAKAGEGPCSSARG
jgi:DEAD/DEAH box helicase domain-containing protein